MLLMTVTVSVGSVRSTWKPRLISKRGADCEVKAALEGYKQTEFASADSNSLYIESTDGKWTQTLLFKESKSA